MEEEGLMTRLARASAWKAEFNASLVLLILQSKTEKVKGLNTLGCPLYAQL